MVVSIPFLPVLSLERVLLGGGRSSITRLRLTHPPRKRTALGFHRTTAVALLLVSGGEIIMELSREEARALDRRAIEEYGIPGAVLMENAGRGMAELLRKLGIQ